MVQSGYNWNRNEIGWCQNRLDIDVTEIAYAVHLNKK